MASAPRELRLGTRGSPLALWQAHAVAAAVAERGGPPCRIVVIRTSGDVIADRPLSEAGGKRLFVKEIEDALLRNDVDLAVHSSKDMPALLPDGLAIAAVLPREDPLDAVILPVRSGGTGHRAETLEDLVAVIGESPNIGTGSVRRIAQLSGVLKGARFAPIRGNLDTRLRKLDAGEHDALVLAAAGLRRLGMASRITMTLPASACVPSPGQGIVAVEIRANDDAVRQIISRIDDGMPAWRSRRNGPWSKHWEADARRRSGRWRARWTPTRSSSSRSWRHSTAAGSCERRQQARGATRRRSDGAPGRI